MKLLDRFRKNHTWHLGPEAIDRFSADPGPWLSCDDCFERCDLEVEATLSGRVGFPADFLAHLRSCSACRDEARTLLELAAEDRGIDPTAAAARFAATMALPVV